MNKEEILYLALTVVVLLGVIIEAGSLIYMLITEGMLIFHKKHDKTIDKLKNDKIMPIISKYVITAMFIVIMIEIILLKAIN